jgi:hypothetical protein
MKFIVNIPDGMKPMDMLDCDADDVIKMLMSAKPTFEMATPVGYGDSKLYKDLGKIKGQIGEAMVRVPMMRPGNKTDTDNMVNRLGKINKFYDAGYKQAIADMKAGRLYDIDSECTMEKPK